jgi:hypothetical protein
MASQLDSAFDLAKAGDAVQARAVIATVSARPLIPFLVVMI